MSSWFTNLPSVNDLLDTAPLKNMLEQVGRNRVVRETAQFLDRVRVDAQSAAQQHLGNPRPAPPRPFRPARRPCCRSRTSSRSPTALLRQGELFGDYHRNYPAALDAFALVIVVLALRPNGLFGRAEVKKV